MRRLEQKPWWVYVCEFIIWAGSIALIGMAAVYLATADSGTGPFKVSWVVFAFLFVVTSLVVSAALIRRLRGESSGWLRAVADILLWMWWWW
jgi:membrane protein implicated in regulation of membrane protease activity